MALECNIDAKGKAARLAGGIASLFGGLVLAGLLLTGVLDGSFWWLSTAGAVFGGAFEFLRRALVGVLSERLVFARHCDR